MTQPKAVDHTAVDIARSGQDSPEQPSGQGFATTRRTADRRRGDRRDADRRVDRRGSRWTDGDRSENQSETTSLASEAGRSDSASDGVAGEANWELVVAAQAGDVDAFGALYDRYVDQIFSYILMKVADRSLAEDLTSETFVRALRKISTISYQGRDIGAWFTTIARNMIFDHAKSAHSRREVSTGDTGDTEAAHDSAELTVLNQLANSRLLAAVGELSEEQQECIILRFIQGFSLAETAALMGKSEGSVKALQYRAVKRLASQVSEDLA